MNYTEAYHRWNATTLDTIRGSLAASSIDAKNIDNEQQALARLKNQGRSATGRLQALQVSSELAGENVNQLLQLKRLMMAQMSAQNAYMAYHVSKDSYHEQALRSVVSQLKTHFPTYHNNVHFGKLSSLL